MPSARDIVYALYGCWRLIRLDTGGLAFFDNTVEGFWRSFLPVAALGPLLLLIDWLSLGDAGRAALPDHWFIADYLLFMTSWALAVAALMPLARILGRDHRFGLYVIAGNWFFVPSVAFRYLTAMLAAAVPEGAHGTFVMVAVAVVIFYDVFVARVALDINVGQAVAVVVILVLLQLLLRMALPHYL